MFVVGSLPFCLAPRAWGLLKIGGLGASVKATLRSTLRSMGAWAPSLSAVRGPPHGPPPHPVPLPDGRSGAPTPYDLDATVITRGVRPRRVDWRSDAGRKYGPPKRESVDSTIGVGSRRRRAARNVLSPLCSVQ